MKKYLREEEKKNGLKILSDSSDMVEVGSKIDMDSLGIIKKTLKKLGSSKIIKIINCYLLLGKSMDKWTFLGSLLLIVLFNLIYWFTPHISRCSN